MTRFEKTFLTLLWVLLALTLVGQLGFNLPNFLSVR
jgi:hypothetical protein